MYRKFFQNIECLRQDSYLLPIGIVSNKINGNHLKMKFSTRRHSFWLTLSKVLWPNKLSTFVELTSTNCFLKSLELSSPTFRLAKGYCSMLIATSVKKSWTIWARDITCWPPWLKAMKSVWKISWIQLASSILKSTSSMKSACTKGRELKIGDFSKSVCLQLSPTDTNVMYVLY